jgi:hypothetical protein
MGNLCHILHLNLLEVPVWMFKLFGIFLTYKDFMQGLRFVRQCFWRSKCYGLLQCINWSIFTEFWRMIMPSWWSSNILGLFDCENEGTKILLQFLMPQFESITLLRKYYLTFGRPKWVIHDPMSQHFNKFTCLNVDNSFMLCVFLNCVYLLFYTIF